MDFQSQKEMYEKNLIRIWKFVTSYLVDTYFYVSGFLDMKGFNSNFWGTWSFSSSLRHFEMMMQSLKKSKEIKI